MPQGKGGAIKPVPTPTPAPRKATPKKATPPARVNAKSSAQPKADDVAATERTYWETIRNSTDVEDFRAYLKKYPNGQFADLANNRIRTLEAPKPQPSPTTTPALTPEPAFEWAKVERDLPAPVRLEWEGKELGFSVPSGWTRTQRELQSQDPNQITYRQLNFRASDSPQTNISIQVYRNYFPRRMKSGRIDTYAGEGEFIERRRKQYASQNVSARLTDTSVINHSTGRWHTFTADVQDIQMVEQLIDVLDAVYPDGIWETKRHGNATWEELKPGALDVFNRTRHSYATRSGSGVFIVMLYTAPINTFDDKLLPSIMGTLKMSGGKLSVYPPSSEFLKYEPEVVIDGEGKGQLGKVGHYLVSAGKHHVIVRAKEHKPFEKDVFLGAWEDQSLSFRLERTATSTSETTPK
jgi:hypothetical protein